VQEWFMAAGIWVIVAIAAGAGLIFLTLRLVRRQAKRDIRHRLPSPARGALRLIAWSVASVIIILSGLAITTVVVRQAGVDIQPEVQAVIDWLREHGTRIAIIIVAAYLSYLILRFSMPRSIERAIRVRRDFRGENEEVTRRAHTLGGMLISLITVIIITVAAFMVLAEIGLNIAPLLAGASVAGVALGFGAQNLVKDLLAGMFIIFEDQYHIGDVVKVADISGVVEEISLRRTIVRDLDGVVHNIPNAAITVASNYSKNYSRVNLDITVSYAENPDRVMAIINKVGADLTHDTVFGPMITSPPKALRVEDLSPTGMVIKVLGETKPLKHWDVMGELRKRILNAFELEGIHIAAPQVHVNFGKTAK
jgi:small-conductance mechanosensitive channel